MCASKPPPELVSHGQPVFCRFRFVVTARKRSGDYSLVPSPLPAAIFIGARKVVWHINFSRKAWHCRTISFCPIRSPENDASLRVITSGVLRASIMDISRLDAKGVAVELVNDAIKHAFLTLGYAAATTDQDKAVREFLQGKDVFVSLPTGEGKSLCFATLLAVFDFLKQHLTVCTGSRTGRYRVRSDNVTSRIVT